MRTALIAFLVAALPAAAQQDFKPKTSRHPQAAIDGAIDRALNWLKSTPPPTLTVSGPNYRHDMSLDELILYALCQGTIPRSDPAIQRCLQAVVDRAPAKTYVVACGAMALSHMDKAGYQWKLEQYAQFLVNTQCANGQWCYGSPVTLAPESPPKFVSKAPPAPGTSPAPGDAPNPGGFYGAKPPPATPGKSNTAALPRIPVRQTGRGPARGDNSNSQYAALGLRACAEAGIEIDPRCVEAAMKWWRQSQNPDGGWSYDREGAQRSSWGSMTVGGVGGLIIYDWLAKRSWRSDPDVTKGIAWLNTNWSVSQNPLVQNMPQAGDGRRYLYYYLYGIERVGMLFGSDRIGTHDWYDEGADFLLKSQRPDGSWVSQQPYEAVMDTCFAVFFLRRATPVLPRVFTGR